MIYSIGTNKILAVIVSSSYPEVEVVIHTFKRERENLPKVANFNFCISLDFNTGLKAERVKINVSCLGAKAENCMSLNNARTHEHSCPQMVG